MTQFEGVDVFICGCCDSLGDPWPVPGVGCGLCPKTSRKGWASNLRKDLVTLERHKVADSVS